ncbi:Nif3-like dinuclear metal center hexameric protein [Enterococcus sp. JM9B]|uniref:Nif3-like dinuclear metal center hexameric protein n=1 Tax=Enterococcus sp. JM9B TaxID=1857216 RepID=UPI001D7C202C|nr:Nif3-like dinuclear metal center hexameric protein [Enterococcus sp. JM9B]
MSVWGTTFIQRFEEYCPLWLAESGDPVGLHLGTLEKPVQRVMMTLDVRPEVVAEAIEKKVDLLIAKHPPIFRPIKRLTTDDPQQKMYIDLVKNDIAVYAAHTNMDIIWGGLNDWFCEMLAIDVEDFMTQTHQVPFKKLAVYVPTENAAAMRQALGDAGAGKQGNYHHTSYSMTGTGRFTPTAEAHPAIGQANQEEEVQETRIEVIFPETKEAAVLQAMYIVHPYEEPAFDILPLNNLPMTYGIGRVGMLEKPLTINELCERVKDVFELEGLRLITADPNKTVQRIAICGGSGEKFYEDALKKHADVYITGDVTYHIAHDMQAKGLTVIDPGHNIERVCIPKFIEKMNEWKAEEQWTIECIPSMTNTNPFQFR